MLIVTFGTTGELIKLAPLLTTLQERGTPAWTLCTGQQVQQIPSLLDDFGLRQPDVWLARGARGHDLERASSIPAWFATVAFHFARRFRAVRAQTRRVDTQPLLLVHGDTFTTVLGAAMGRAAGLPVGHIEAGLRSGHWRHPFPEELDRLATSKLARIHFAPDAVATANLRRARVRGDVVDTGGNTIRDALALVPQTPPTVELPGEPFGVVSMHRFELLSNPDAFRAIVELLSDAGRRWPLLFVDHPVTAAAIEAQGLGHLFHGGLQRIPRQRYFNFVALLKASAFLVTDSGGSQEECAVLGKPCLVHRFATERQDGLDGPVVLSRLDLDAVRTFLADPLAHTRPPINSEVRPTDRIITFLREHDFLA